jgi:hypothetical protein
MVVLTLPWAVLSLLLLLLTLPRVLCRMQLCFRQLLLLQWILLLLQVLAWQMLTLMLMQQLQGS